MRCSRRNLYFHVIRNSENSLKKVCTPSLSDSNLHPVHIISAVSAVKGYEVFSCNTCVYLKIIIQYRDNLLEFQISRLYDPHLTNVKVSEHESFSLKSK